MGKPNPLWDKTFSSRTPFFFLLGTFFQPWAETRTSAEHEMMMVRKSLFFYGPSWMNYIDVPQCVCFTTSNWVYLRKMSLRRVALGVESSWGTSTRNCFFIFIFLRAEILLNQSQGRLIAAGSFQGLFQMGCAKSEKLHPPWTPCDTHYLNKYRLIARK